MGYTGPAWMEEGALFGTDATPLLRMQLRQPWLTPSLHRPDVDVNEIVIRPTSQR